MGMYCCCDEKIEEDNEWECTCDWTGWISCCDWPAERKNKQTPLGLPARNGRYLTRTQTNSADRYEEIKYYSVIPRIEMGGYFGPPIECRLHWEGETWEGGRPYAWKED